MALTRYEKATRVLLDYMKENNTNIIYTNTLKTLIRRYVGGDENRVMFPTLKMLRDENIINEVKPNIWEIKIEQQGEHKNSPEPNLK